MTDDFAVVRQAIAGYHADKDAGFAALDRIEARLKAAEHERDYADIAAAGEALRASEAEAEIERLRAEVARRDHSTRYLSLEKTAAMLAAAEAENERLRADAERLAEAARPLVRPMANGETHHILHFQPLADALAAHEEERSSVEIELDREREYEREWQTNAEDEAEEPDDLRL